ARRRRISARESSAVIARPLQQKPLQLIGSAFPEGLLTRNPSAGLFKGLASQPEPMDAALHPSLYDSGFFQHFEVLGNGGLGRAELAAQFAGAAAFPFCKRMNHRAPSAIGQCMEGEIERRARIHSHMTI